MSEPELLNGVVADPDDLFDLQRFALQLVLPVLALFGLTATLSSFMAHTHRMRKVFVGSVGLVASISMYSSPMVAAVSIYLS
jgi:solute carrier family 50 protein (sugar transporter)